MLERAIEKGHNTNRAKCEVDFFFVLTYFIGRGSLCADRQEMGTEITEKEDAFCSL